MRKRSGEQVFFAAEVVAVAQELMVHRLSPERAHVSEVLMAAAKVLGIVPAACELHFDDQPSADTLS